MKEKIFSVLQRVGRAFMLPIAILPVAGLLLGIGSSFTNVTTLETYHLMNIMGPGTFLYSILTVMNKCGSIIFDNLPLIFAIGVAIGMAKKEKEVAALAAAIAFLVMHSAIGAIFHRANLRFYYSLRYSSVYIRDNRFFSPFFAFKTINSFKSHFFACFSGQNVVKYKRF